MLRKISEAGLERNKRSERLKKIWMERISKIGDRISEGMGNIKKTNG